LIQNQGRDEVFDSEKETNRGAMRTLLQNTYIGMTVKGNNINKISAIT
jgi:hypothetical protein